MLTDRQKLARKGKITASRIGVLMSGDARAVYDLWLELTGDPSYTPPDLSHVWPVQLGAHTEPFHLDWLEGWPIGKIIRRGESLQHPTVPWAMCTLDGWSTDQRYPVEVKHTGGFEGMDKLIERYMPQLQWIMWCANANEIIFSVIMGAKEPQVDYIRRDIPFSLEMIKRATEFIGHVHNLTEPVANPYVKPPKPVFTRRVDMNGNNKWADAAHEWIGNRLAHQTYEATAKVIKELVPADAKEAFGYGIIVTRNKAGSLTIKQETDNAE